MSTGLKGEIERLYDKGVRCIDIRRLTGATTSYVEYVVSGARAGGPTTTETREAHAACDRKHLWLVSAGSNGKGFPYCVRAG